MSKKTENQGTDPIELGQLAGEFGASNRKDDGAVIGDGASNREDDDDGDINDDDPFAEFEDKSEDDIKSKKDIIKELLSSKRCKAYRGLTIKNVEHKIGNNNTYFSFTIKDAKVIGNASVNNVNVIQKTNAFAIGSFAVRSTMFDDVKMSIFANDVLVDDKLVTKLLNGGKIDIIAHLVKAGEEYVNPFSSTDGGHVFTEDIIIHYVTGLTFGPVGEDYYRAYLNR